MVHSIYAVNPKPTKANWEKSETERRFLFTQRDAEIWWRWSWKCIKKIIFWFLASEPASQRETTIVGYHSCVSLHIITIYQKRRAKKKRETETGKKWLRWKRCERQQIKSNIDWLIPIVWAKKPNNNNNNKKHKYRERAEEKMDIYGWIGFQMLGTKCAKNLQMGRCER